MTAQYAQHYSLIAFFGGGPMDGAFSKVIVGNDGLPSPDAVVKDEDRRTYGYLRSTLDIAGGSRYWRYEYQGELRRTL